MIRLFNAGRLAEELSRKEVSSKDKGYYLAASFILFTVFQYTGLISSANYLWSPLSIYEGLLTIVITVVGFAKCYEAAGGDRNSEFVVEFSCLYTPVSVTTVLLVWGMYWAVTLGFRESILRLSDKHFPLAEALMRWGSNFIGLLSFLAVVLVQAISFYRICRLLESMHSEQLPSEDHA